MEKLKSAFLKHQKFLECANISSETLFYINVLNLKILNFYNSEERYLIDKMIIKYRNQRFDFEKYSKIMVDSVLKEIDRFYQGGFFVTDDEVNSKLKEYITLKNINNLNDIL